MPLIIGGKKLNRANLKNWVRWVSGYPIHPSVSSIKKLPLIKKKTATDYSIEYLRRFTKILRENVPNMASGNEKMKIAY